MCRVVVDLAAFGFSLRSNFLTWHRGSNGSRIDCLSLVVFGTSLIILLEVESDKDVPDSRNLVVRLCKSRIRYEG